MGSVSGVFLQISKKKSCSKLNSVSTFGDQGQWNYVRRGSAGCFTYLKRLCDLQTTVSSIRGHLWVDDGWSLVPPTSTIQKDICIHKHRSQGTVHHQSQRPFPICFLLRGHLPGGLHPSGNVSRKDHSPGTFLDWRPHGNWQRQGF